MASTSNPPDAIARIQDYEYLYASNTNVSNFVSVKLSGCENYDLWKTQMLCLMKAHEMCWLVDDSSTPEDLSEKIKIKYDSLLKGWIFGSIKEDVLRIVVDPKYYYAKNVWIKLKSCFDSTMSSKKDSAATKVDTKTGTEDNNMGLGETATNDEGISSKKPEAKGKEAIQIETKDSTSTKVDTKIETENNNMALEETSTNHKGLCSEISEATDEEPTQIETKDSVASKVDKEIEAARDIFRNQFTHTSWFKESANPDYVETETNKLRQLIADKNWFEEYFNEEERNALAENINHDGNTLIHTAIRMGRNGIIDSLISNLGAIDLTVIKDSDGSTVLHIAAIVGNAYAAKRLSKCDPILLHIRDNEFQTPLQRAHKNEHLLTIAYLEKRKDGTKINKLPQLIVDEKWGELYLQLKERFLLTAKINSDGDRLLHIAVRVGDAKLISEILGSIYMDEDEDDFTGKTNSDGSTVLHIAAIVGNKKAAKLLVKENPNLLHTKDNEGHTPLDKANENAHRNVASILVAAEKEDKKLRKQIEDGDWHAVYHKLKERDALTEKIDSNGNTLLHKAVEINRNDLVERILRHISEFKLLDMTNSDGSTPLHIAAIVGNTDAAVLLVRRREGLLDVRDNEYLKPLDKANENGHLNTIEYLREARYTPAVTNELRQLIGEGDWLKVYTELKRIKAITEKIDRDGNTLLHKAVEINHNDLVKRILPHIRKHDLSKNTNFDGSTVLHVAAIVGNMDAAALLVKHDRNLLDVRDDQGKTPLDKANGNGHLINTFVNLQEAAKKTEAVELQQLILDGDWYEVIVKLHKRNALNEKINSNGNTLLHKVVGMGDEFLIGAILWRITKGDLTENKNSDGSTTLHIAAIVGNKNAAKMLVEKNKDLLHTKDNDGKTPLDKAYQNMHLDTIAYLLEATEDHEKGQEKGKEVATVDPERKKDADVKIGVDLLTNAISAKRYDVALNLIGRNPEYAVFDDNVLMAMARTFPNGLDYTERLIYPSLDNTSEMIVRRTRKFFNLLVEKSSDIKDGASSILHCEFGFKDTVLNGFLLIIIVPLVMGYWIYQFIPLLISMVYFPFFMIYLLLWKAAKVVPPVKNIEQKKKEYMEAKEVLELVLNTIKEKCPESSLDLYTKPILEAARQDAYEVVDQILGRWPEAIHCKDKNGYDIFQLATIHRSERIYNMIYIIGEHKNTYRTIQDSSKNNMLHLVGKLAPSNKLKRRTGAALQLQRELQWRQEVEKLVFPTFVTKENIFMETPEMVFTKEHEILVKEGEKWIKTVAESCSITAALITTIVFAAAITVPGGNDQQAGIPVFRKKDAFTIFAIADAISLFSSTTALLVFLSILTARFAEQDFLVRLPRRLIIGLCTLLISTTAMMVAFSATLFLVFSHQKRWVLAPICALAFIPIAFFFVLQFPLILDLLQSTYIFKFGKSDINKNSKLVQNDVGFIVSM